MSDIEGTTAPIGAARRNANASNSPNRVLAIVCVGIVLANLDLFIVNVGLPSIGHDLGDTSLEHLSWVLNGYAIAYAALLVFFGRLAERYRRNMSFHAGVALFTGASAACAAATSVEMLVVFRIAQAAGAALMTPASLGLILASFPPERRGGAVRTWTALGGFAAALGPLVGGLLVAASWRWIFLVNVPIGLAALWVGWRHLPDIAGHDAPKPHPFAAVLVIVGIAALTFAIVKASDWGWHSPWLYAVLLVAFACIALFTIHCLRSKNPFVDPTLFAIRPFTGSSIAMTLFSIGFSGMLLSIVLWEQSVWGWSAMQIGWTIAPGPLLVPTVSLLFAKSLIGRFGVPRVVTAGVLLFSCGVLCWGLRLAEVPDLASELSGMVMIGAGVGLVLPTLMGAGMGSLPASAFATGSGVINMLRQTGLAIGVAVLVAILGTPDSMPQRMGGFRLGWWFIIATVLACLVPTWTLIRPRPAKT